MVQESILHKSGDVFMIFPHFPIVFYLPDNWSAEATALIKKHVDNRAKLSVWYAELGKDLSNYVSRPELIQEVYNQMFAPNYQFYVVVMNAELIEQLKIAQIETLLKNKTGFKLLDLLQISLGTYKNNQYASVDVNKLNRLFLKIERVRIPIISNDKRPYVGEMVAPEEDMGIDPSISTPRIPFSNRFGGNHDGEHWLTKTIGAEVRATAGICGTVLTYYGIGYGLSAVMIHLKNTNIVMLIKDLVTIGQKIKQAKPTTRDDSKTALNETVFTNKAGNPFKPIELVSGDLIGTTTKWEKLGAKNFYQGYGGIYGTFHFALLKLEKAQEYRSKIGHKDESKRGEGVTVEPGDNPNAIPLDWFIPIFSPQSPVKCFT